MDTMSDAPAVDAPERLFEHVQELQDQLDATGDEATRELADELVSSVVQMYGTGLERILEVLTAAPAGERIVGELAEDPYVATLLLIHGLHPVALEQRVQQALHSVRPYMESHGGDVELLSLEDGVARLHLQGSCSDCSASSVTLELAIKQALEEAAPDLEGLEVEGMAPQMPGLALPMAQEPSSGTELPVIPASPPRAPSWVDLDGPVSALSAGELATVDTGAGRLLVANVDGTLLAYRDVCAGCGASLQDASLVDGALGCARCRRTFFLPRAGRSLDDEGLQLEPVPLLREGAGVKVALAA